MSIERRFTNLGNHTTRVDKVETVSFAVPYGARDREIILSTTIRTDPSLRTLTRTQRRKLREENRLGRRQNSLENIKP